MSVLHHQALPAPEVIQEVSGPARGIGPDSGAFPFITRGVSNCGLAIYIKKYFKAKEE